MARGGIRDHVGGGFHRYSVDARWIVPHFEKMSYDNSELLRAYSHAATASGLPAGDAEGPELNREVVEGIARWVEEVMSDPAGGYHASQDADVGPDDDGDYFTWTPDEVRAVTEADEFSALARRYDIEEVGEMHHNPQKNVLWLKQSPSDIAAALGQGEAAVEQLLASGLAKLAEARTERPQPFVDTTLYTGWNGLMASAMLGASALLDRPDLERHAVLTLDRLFDEATEPDLSGGMRHAPGSEVSGILDDQVMVAQAAIDAFEATGEAKWLDRAERLMAQVMSDYSADDGRLLDTLRGRGGEGFLDQEIKPIQDSPTPSGSGVAGIVLSRLFEHTGRDEWRAYRDDLLEGLAGDALQLGIFAAAVLRAVDWAVMPAAHVVVVGEDDENTRELRRVARNVYRPRKVLRWLRPSDPTESLPEAVRAMLDGQAPRAYVCAGTQCAAPVATAAALAETLRTFAVTR
jgi:uncharacterized protein YyaL (SSP411 family)